MNTYILTEGRNFKIFLKENYAIALDSCYLFTKKMLNKEFNLILIVFIEFAFYRYEHEYTYRRKKFQNIPERK